MDALRKTLAIITMILAMIGLLICLGGLIGSIAVNEPAAQAMTGALSAMENTLTIADQAAQTAAASLSEAQQGVDRVNQTASGLTAEDKAQAAAALQSTVEQTIGPSVARARTLATSLSTAVVQFNATLESVNRIPGLSVPTLTDELQTAGQILDQAQEAAGEVRSAVADAATLDGSRITAATAKTASGLQTAQDAIAQGQARMSAASAAIAATKASIPGWIDAISLAAALLFILFGAGQVSMFLLAWRWFKQPKRA
jgi:hypothetical protein